MKAEIREAASRQAETCKVFGSAIRVLILWALNDGEMSVSEIASATDISLQNASQHLRLMRDKRILSCRREGSTVYYQINQSNMKKSCRHLLAALYEVLTQE